MLVRIRNVLGEADDTLTISAIVDTVHSAGGDIVSGTLLASGQVTVTGGDVRGERWYRHGA